jgi:hypothetical protein
MNEHLFQLAEESGAVVRGTFGKPMNLDELEQFAKLIVEQCARIARATPCPYEEAEVRQRLGHTWDMASLEAGREIVTHFGVDE